MQTNIFSAETISKLTALKSKLPSGANRNIISLPLEVVDIIYNIGVKLPKKFDNELYNIYKNNFDIIVCISAKNYEILPVQKNAIFAKHIGNMLKLGYKIVNIDRHSARLIDWHNWKPFYNYLVPQSYNNGGMLEPSRDELTKIRNERAKEREFYELAKPIRSKKRCRTRITFEDAQLQRRTINRVNYEVKINREFAKIMGQL